MAVAAPPAAGSASGALSGPAVVSDGDTLRIAGRVVRLHAIDAPETGQVCRDASGRPWDCAGAAMHALARLAADGLACAPRGAGGYGRVAAVCRTPAGIDVGAALVRSGLAVAYLRYGADYARHERAARAERRGVWQGRAERPEDWRRARRAGAATASSRGPAGCVVKGNVSGNGRIYHLPGQQHYARTRIDPARGERWFCSASEARAAGWRPARR